MAKKKLLSETETITPKVQGAMARDRGLLTVVAGVATGQILAVGERDDLSIGRGDDCTLSVADGGLSREHARVLRVAGVFFLADKKSRNGSFVNGERVKDPIKLKDGDRIQLGPATILTFSLVDAQEEAALQSIHETTLRDALTGLYNRRHLEHQLGVEVAGALRAGRPLSVAMLDIDHFKKVNDTHGHAAGDAVLKGFAAAVSALIRPNDLFARYGGEEFTLILQGTDRATAAQLAERLRASIEQTALSIPDCVLSITSSGGVASLDECPDSDPATLMKLADDRLYRAKQGGRNRVVWS